ncbi:discoidin domain-containing protein [Kitasatospora sp. NPDC057015]|uniref:discoidin domain-containing protein n=1 Tax=Kitasatospora sp. NPDC057015 TaxID=3346001 RepID=UPI0036278A9F
MYSAPVASGSNSRQLYIDGKEVPIAQATPSKLTFTGSWTGSSTGYTISGDAKATAWFGALTASQVSGVEFVYPDANGAWTESRCRVASYSATAGTLTMAQPCWTNTTNRASYSQGTGPLPSMSTSQMPSRIENAQTLIDAGRWFLDSAGSTLYYKPVTGQQMAGLDVELPRLEKLVQGAGTLASPLHDISFKGLQFSYATWNDPSTTSGFAEVQSNLRLSLARNQGMCSFSTPAGSCPWGALTQPLANIAFTATKNLTLSGNRFAELGGAGLSVMYGSVDTLIQGNEFTDIASTALLLGCTYDPLPTDPTEATGIKQNCTPDAAAVSGDTIGTNEILTGTTVSDNFIHHIGTDYPAACGITLLFSQHTTITRNNLYDLPYTGVTAGVIQGHVDNASHPQNSSNINSFNTISNNIFHDVMSVRSDGGPIYAEGHQAQYVYKADGTTIDSAATLAGGLQATGNIAYNGRNTNFSYYDDAGSEWINWQGNVAFGAVAWSQGGCSPTGHFWVTDNYFSGITNRQACSLPVDVHESGTTVISATPKPGDIPNAKFSGAGVGSGSFTPTLSVSPSIFYVSPTTNATQVLIGGEGFTSATPVYIGNKPISGVIHLSSGFLIAPVPTGTKASQINLDPSHIRVNDTDTSITYSSDFGYLSGRGGFGDYQGDIHYSMVNGSTATFAFSGTGLQVYGEQYTDQGNIGISIDGGTQVTVSTFSTDGARHGNVAVYTSGTLSAGDHTVVVTKLSGTYTTIDGFASLNTTGAPTPQRIAQSSMSVKYVDSAETAAENGAGANVLDGSPATAWVTKWSGTAAPLPHEIQLDLGKNYSVSELYYLPRTNTPNGRIKDYQVYTSTDGTTWGTAVATGTFPNNATEQKVTFAAVTARYIRLVATSEVNGNPWTSIAELNVGAV